MRLFNFISRGIFSPLLPIFEEQYGVSHGRSSTIFLIMSLSMSTSMVFSGFISKRLTHRGTIILYEFMIGLSLILCALSPSFLFVQLCTALLGISAGLYAPSGVASVTTLAGEEHWGKALGIHELGPNLGLICAPLVVGFAAPVVRWEIILAAIGIGNCLNGLFYAIRGRGGDFRGAPPNFKNLKLIFGNRSFWILAAYLVLAASSAIGIYSILPTYLISDKGFNPQLVNTIVGFSRVTGLLFILGAGYLVDKFGIRLFLGLTLGLSALFAVSLGVLEESPLLVAVFFQPMIISAFFPVANTAISSITIPETRNVAFSMIIPFASAFGAGITPTIMGNLGEIGRFSEGFIILGGLTMASLLLLPFLHISKKRDI
ncbi:MAG: MFS transporter [Spirochaetia bacterium]